jgi:ATP-dependent Lon protease
VLRVSQIPVLVPQTRLTLSFIYRKVRGANPPADTLKAAETELRKLRKMTEQAPGFGSTRQWIECIASLPWSVEAAASHAGPERAIGEARGVLDKKHYGLDRVKVRIGPFPNPAYLFAHTRLTLHFIISGPDRGVPGGAAVEA